MFPTEDLIKELREVKQELDSNAGNEEVNIDNLFKTIRRQNEAILKYFEIKSRQPV